MTEKELIHELHFAHGGLKNYMFPNVFAFNDYFESDLVKVTPAGYTTEYEIKCTMADFLADSKKVEPKWGPNPRFKHDLIRDGLRENQFYFVTTFEVGVPDWAGHLLWNGFEFKVVKAAPRLHKNPITSKRLQRLFVSVHHRYWSLRLAK